MRDLLRSTTAYRTVKADAARGVCAHAALVLFPDAVYLRELLRECAKAFFGAADGGRTAQLLEEEQYPDCLILPAAGAKLTADDGAHIIDESLLRPVEGEKKLFVLDAFHNCTPLVQNKLLKVLEEPPAGVYFLLGATADFSVLPTVLSRVKRLEVAPFSEEAVAAALRRKYPEQTGHARAAAACGGIFSAAEALLCGGGESFAFAERFLLGQGTEALIRGVGDKADKSAYLAAIRLYLRDMLFYRTGQGRFASGGLAGAERLAEAYPAGALVKALELVAEAETQVRFNANFGQCLLSLSVAIEEEKEKWQKLS